MEELGARKWVIITIMGLVGLILVSKLFYLQIVDISLKAQASDVGKKVLYPSRGIVFDRNQNLIVRNKPSYDILVVQKDIGKIDTSKFCRLLGIEKEVFVNRMKELKENKKNYFSKYKPELFLSQIPAENIFAFEEHLFEFTGFYTRVKDVRAYPYSAGAHIVGDIGEVSQYELKKDDGYYSPGDQIGKSGIEKSFEKNLRGVKGVRYYLKDKLGREISIFENGKFDTLPSAGKDLNTTIDIALQEYGEKLMQNKRGSIVAIVPETGEILALVSSPSYDPNLLVGRDRGKNFFELNGDTANRPLINRPVTARYPPGSIFKPFMGLVALQEGAVRFDGNGGYSCTGGGYFYSGRRLGCHNHPPIKSLNTAIQYSCNAYFCNGFKKLIEHPKFADEKEALNKWGEYLASFHLGRPFSLETKNTNAGLVPDAKYYDRIYKEYRWRANTIISLAIGQGEILATPIHMANLYAILANRGWYIEPHLVRQEAPREAIKTMISGRNYERILDGLENVVESGTARRAKIPGIPVLGKTGTAENPHGEDHSIFAAFAPRDLPQIAIAVVVENSGYGGTWAAPIASLMIEKYIRGQISEEKKIVEQQMLEANFLE